MNLRSSHMHPSYNPKTLDEKKINKSEHSFLCKSIRFISLYWDVAKQGGRANKTNCVLSSKSTGKFWVSSGTKLKQCRKTASTQYTEAVIYWRRNVNVKWKAMIKCTFNEMEKETSENKIQEVDERTESKTVC